MGPGSGLALGAAAREPCERRASGRPGGGGPRPPSGRGMPGVGGDQGEASVAAQGPSEGLRAGARPCVRPPAEPTGARACGVAPAPVLARSCMPAAPAAQSACSMRNGSAPAGPCAGSQGAAQACAPGGGAQQQHGVAATGSGKPGTAGAALRCGPGVARAAGAAGALSRAACQRATLLQPKRVSLRLPCIGHGSSQMTGRTALLDRHRTCPASAMLLSLLGPCTAGSICEGWRRGKGARAHAWGMRRRCASGRAARAPSGGGRRTRRWRRTRPGAPSLTGSAAAPRWRSRRRAQWCPGTPTAPCSHTT